MGQRSSPVMRFRCFLVLFGCTVVSGYSHCGDRGSYSECYFDRKTNLRIPFFLPPLGSTIKEQEALTLDFGTTTRLMLDLTSSPGLAGGNNTGGKLFFLEPSLFNLGWNKFNVILDTDDGGATANVTVKTNDAEVLKFHVEFRQSQDICVRGLYSEINKGIGKIKVHGINNKVPLIIYKNKTTVSLVIESGKNLEFGLTLTKKVISYDENFTYYPIGLKICTMDLLLSQFDKRHYVQIGDFAFTEILLHIWDEATTGYVEIKNKTTTLSYRRDLPPLLQSKGNKELGLRILSVVAIASVSFTVLVLIAFCFWCREVEKNPHPDSEKEKQPKGVTPSSLQVIPRPEDEYELVNDLYVPLESRICNNNLKQNLRDGVTPNPMQGVSQPEDEYELVNGLYVPLESRISNTDTKPNLPDGVAPSSMEDEYELVNDLYVPLEARIGANSDLWEK